MYLEGQGLNMDCSATKWNRCIKLALRFKCFLD